MRLLLVEDDPVLGDSLRLALTHAGFAVDVETEGQGAEFRGATEPYDLVVLDLGLPGMNGMEILKSWRSAGRTMPVLVLSARDAWHERIDGFKAGADDYLGKPFHMQELIARLLALAKRSHGHAPSPLQGAGLSLDEERQTVTIDGVRTESLTAIEFRLLRTLMLHPGKVLSKAHLMEHVYGSEGDPDSNVLEVYINRLRRKLGKDLITTRRHQGYIFGEVR